MNNAKKFVASRTLNKVDWNNSTLLKGDVVQEIRKLKDQDGPELQVHGSSNFVQTLLQNALVDLYNVWIFPVVIGTGKRLFDHGTIPAALRLVSSTVSTTGVIITTYEPAGELKVGSFALENPTQAELERRKGLK